MQVHETLDDVILNNLKPYCRAHASLFKRVIVIPWIFFVCINCDVLTCIDCILCLYHLNSQMNHVFHTCGIVKSFLLLIKKNDFFLLKKKNI